MRASSRGVTTTIAAVLLTSSLGFGADLKQSKFTQVVNDVKVLEQSSKKTKAAQANDVFKMPDMIRTGPASRAELIAEDNTITRIGANSIFSFDPANRTINLEKGSILFQAPKGKGGGTIRTSSAAASVLGTTMIVSATPDGGFKVLLLEGSSKVTLPNGQTVNLKPGQMVFVLPNGGGFSPVITFKLEDQVQGSLLVTGFDNELPSMDLIELEITRQNELIANGRALDTGLLATDIATSRTVQTVDPIVLQQYFNDNTLHNPPSFFDIIINDTVAGFNITQNEGSSILRGNNILINGPEVDLNPANSFSFYLEAAGVMQFAENEFNETTFFSTGNQVFDRNTLAEVPLFGPANLQLVANEFRFPNSFNLSFDGNFFGLHSLSDFAVNSTDGEGGVRIRNQGEFFNGTLGISAERDIRLSGNVRLYGYRVEMEAGRNIIMNGGYIGFSQNANLTAGNVISLKNVGFGFSQQFMNISAKTVVLENVAFNSGSTIYLRSQVGLLALNPNTGASVQPGYVNFINNVTYAGNPAQEHVGINIFISSLNNSNTARIRR